MDGYPPTVTTTSTPVRPIDTVGETAFTGSDLIVPAAILISVLCLAGIITLLLSGRKKTRV